MTASVKRSAAMVHISRKFHETGIIGIDSKLVAG